MKKFYTHTHILLPVVALLFSISGNAQVEEHSDLYSESGTGAAYINTAYSINTDDVNELTNVIGVDVEFLDVKYNDGANKSYSLHGVAGKTLKEIFEGQNTETQVVDITQLRNDYFEWFGLADRTVTLKNCNAVARKAVTPMELVEITDDLSNENSQGTQYEHTAYFVKAPATMDDLANIMVSPDKHWLNVYVNNTSIENQPYDRIDIHIEAVDEGKSLKYFLEGNGITLNQLYFDYKEWFKDASDNHTLVRCNIKATEQVGSSVLQKFPELFAEGQHDHYQITAYKINITATGDETELAAEMILAKDVDFVNIYKKAILPFRYNVVHVEITADISIKDILDNVGLTGLAPEKLKDNYREWFTMLNEDGSFSPVLENINFKAVKTIGTLPKVTKTEGLFSSGSYEYQNIAYYINSNATPTDIEAYTVTADFINVYALDSEGNEVRYNLNGVAGKNLKEIFEGGSTEGTVISIADLRLDFSSWFTDVDGEYKLVNLNVKENIILPDAEKIIITEDLKSVSGSTTFDNTAYLVKSSAGTSDLAKITLDADVNHLNVYTDVEGDDKAPNGRYTLHGVGGKTLDIALTAAGNNEDVDIDITTLRGNYVEWFKDASDKVTLVNLNIKDVKEASLSNDNISSISTSVYPNPVVNELHISIPDNMSFNYSIFNITGELMFRGSSDTNETSIDVSRLNKGVYMLKLDSGNSTFASKFIK